MTRRVYDIDAAMLKRIEAFRDRFQAKSEVDAVRMLIDAGLASLETKDDLIARYQESAYGWIFGGHPLVRSMHQEDGNLVKVVFRDGSSYEPKGGAA